jgi:hypothetical protein
MSSDFERFVARAMREPADAGTSCPSAETLAAYLERRLGRDEHASVELHASRCSRCAAHLAALVQLEDQLAAGASPSAPWWRRRPWLVPAAAAIVAGVVWTSLPRERVAELTQPAVTDAPRARTEQDGRRGAEPATAERLRPPAATSAPATPLPAPATPLRAPSATPAPSEAARQKVMAPPPRSGSPLAKNTLDDRFAASAAGRPQDRATDPEPKAGEDSSSRADAERRMLQESTQAMGSRPGAPAAAAPLPSAPVTAAPQPSAGRSSGALANEVSPPAPSEASDSVARRDEIRADAAAAAVPQQKSALQPRLALAGGSPVIASAADPKVAWRVTGGRVERTTDGGARWVVERAPILMPPVSGSSPSREACWLIGDGNVIARRLADGSWRRVFVTDLVAAAVEAQSAVEATLTSTDGRRFATTDGGMTWTEVR